MCKVSTLSCFFCNKTVGKLHKVETLELDSKVRHMAIEMMETDIVAKLTGGDMAATDSVYHSKCLVSFKNRYRAFSKSTVTSSTDQSTHEHQTAMVFAELIAYIESY